MLPFSFSFLLSSDPFALGFDSFSIEIDVGHEEVNRIPPLVGSFKKSPIIASVNYSSRVYGLLTTMSG
jgi:hypothetical protein